MKSNIKHILTISVIIIISFSYYNLNITYKFGQLDFFWSPSMHYAYSNIFKDYYFDFFNSFNLYDTELGFNHIFYPFSPLNPFYSLSFIGLADHAIKISNLFAILSGAFFLLRISQILNFSWPKTYILVLLPVTFVGMYSYAFNQAALNSLIFIWLYVLFYFDLKNRSVNYSFYVFFVIFAALTSNFIILFHLIILFFILFFFYKFKKEHIPDLVFFFMLNFIIWILIIFPYFVSGSNLAHINYAYLTFILFLITFFILSIFYFLKLKPLSSSKFEFFKLLRNSTKIKIFLMILTTFLCLIILKLIYQNQSIVLDILKPNKTYNILTFFYKYDFQYLIFQVKDGSAVFLYIPIGLLIFTLITLPKKSKIFKISCILIIFILIFTYILNSQFFYNYTGARYLRSHLNYIPLIVLLFIYLNLFDDTNLSSENNIFLFNKIKINKHFVLTLVLTLDIYIISIFNPNPKNDSYLYLILLYIPFIILSLRGIVNRKKYACLVLAIFFVLQPILNVEIVNNIGGGFSGVKPNQFSLSQYNTFMDCYRDKSNYTKYDRVLATSTSSVKSGRNSSRFKAPILVMMTERERSKGINVLYRRIEIDYSNLFRSYSALLDYKYFGKYKWSPVFYNKVKDIYFFNETFFDQLGVSSVVVFNDNQKKFQSKYKSFKFQDTCKTDLYKADIYKSTKPRGAAIVIDKNERIKKLKYTSKNSWDISMLDQSKQDKFILKFAQYPETRVYIDDQKVDFNIIKGNLVIPFKKGETLKILYQNDFHRLHFILVNFLYILILFLIMKYILNVLRKINLNI